MKIYIPSHLREIPILDKLIKMISEYTSNYYVDYSSSLDDFYSFYIKIDPVKRFLELVLPKSSFPESTSEEEYEDFLNYIVSLFYSVKGTLRIRDYMEKYLIKEDPGTSQKNFRIDEFSYNGTVLNIKIELGSKLKEGRDNLFYGCLIDFLDTLLYYDKNLSNIEVYGLTLDIDDIIQAYTNFNISNYQEFNIYNREMQQ